MGIVLASVGTWQSNQIKCASREEISSL